MARVISRKLPGDIPEVIPNNIFLCKNIDEDPVFELLKKNTDLSQRAASVTRTVLLFTLERGERLNTHHYIQHTNIFRE